MASFLLELQQDRALPVIEAARLGLCSALARRGHDLHVFAKCLRPGQRNGVYFHHRGESAQFAETYFADALVVVPEVLPLLMPVPARARIVWTGNAFTNGGLRLGCPLGMGNGAGARRAECASVLDGAAAGVRRPSRRRGTMACAIHKRNPEHIEPRVHSNLSRRALGMLPGSSASPAPLPPRLYQPGTARDGSIAL